MSMKTAAEKASTDEDVQHTLGPWRVVFGSDAYVGLAPDLLEAATEALELMEGQPCAPSEIDRATMDKLRRAIANAGGVR
jgi:hypothetical protein